MPILAVEDDVAIRRLFGAAFESTEFKLIEATTASEGLELLVRRRPDLILLDLSLPDLDGLAFVKKVREWSSTPIIIVSGRGEEGAKIAALESGADDYVTKPFGVGELIARIKVALRHAALVEAGADEAVIEHGDLRIDIAGREVFVGPERVHLTPIEFKLLATLARHAGKVVTQRQLLNEVWGPEYGEEAQYLRVYMGYLRKKIELDSARPKLLLTEPRIGYRLAI